MSHRSLIAFCLMLMISAFALSPTADAAATDSAATDSAAADRQRPRVGLALSGGGAKGFAHIGVLKVLESAGVPIDCISGTSMGSIVGALYAIGYSVDEIEAIALESDWEDIFSDAITRRDRPIEQKLVEDRYLLSLPLVGTKIGLPRGLIAGQKVSALLDRLTLPVHGQTSFRELPIPFSCVATDIVTGEAVVLDSGFLPEAIRASMAIPSAFTPVEIDGRLLVDGMLVRNFPVQDVIDLGADLVVGVDVGTPLANRDELKTFVQILGQAIGFIGAESTARQRGMCDVLIAPDVNDVTALDFKKMREIIAAGEAAARQALPQLQDLVAGLGEIVPRDEPRPVAPDSFLVWDVVIDGLAEVDPEIVRSVFGIDPRSRVSLADIEAGVARTYSTGMFERVTFRAEPVSDATRLRLAVIEKTDDYFRFGLRYNTEDRLLAIFNVLYKNHLGVSSMLNVDAVVGGRSELVGEYLIHPLPERSLTLATRIGYLDDEDEVYSGRDRIAKYDQSALFAEVNVGSTISNRSGFGIGLRGEWVSLDPDVVADDLYSYQENMLILVGTGAFDTLDRSYFPRSGVSLFTRHEYSEGSLGSEGTFSRHFADLKFVIPLRHRVSLICETAAGTTTGDDVPTHFNFILGGVDTPALLFERKMTAISFYGLHRQQRVGTHLQFAQLGAQYEIGSQVVLQLMANAGNTFDEWELDFSEDRFETGAGITVGVYTPLGPIQLTGMYGSADQYLGYLNIGMKF